MLASEGSPPAQGAARVLEGGGEAPHGVSVGHAPQTSAIGAIDEGLASDVLLQHMRLKCTALSCCLCLFALFIWCARLLFIMITS